MATRLVCPEDGESCICGAGPNEECQGNALEVAMEGATFRTFETGATRDADTGKLDYEGFLSPLVLRRYAEYMHENRHMKDGTLRDSDNWQQGIPFEAYMKSSWRHFMDWWLDHRGHETETDIQRTLCAIIFNASGYLHELLKIEEGQEGLEDLLDEALSDG